MAALFVSFMPHPERFVSEAALPYVFVFTQVALIILGKLLYERVPRRLVIPIGVVGWLVTFSLLWWFFTFGPGGVKMEIIY
jgi:hypothetical protein